MNITVTESAIAELQLNKEHDIQFYRMGVAPGGCSGFRYTLSLEDHPMDDDWNIEASPDVRILVDPFSSQYLEGAEIDYKKTLTESGFVFNNPNSSGGCGCGSSFSA